jgi:hypothetical protein
VCFLVVFFGCDAVNVVVVVAARQSLAPNERSELHIERSEVLDKITILLIIYILL